MVVDTIIYHYYYLLSPLFIIIIIIINIIIIDIDIITTQKFCFFCFFFRLYLNLFILLGSLCYLVVIKNYVCMENEIIFGVIYICIGK